ncbi:hypothetical protein [Oligella urethralis]|uniref:hypothetical protein n=1 Tax=Oligella urethralis TaxID=90245 RepID=UPI0012E00592|nr:hypothetical protein [Oligella urethralis]
MLMLVDLHITIVSPALGRPRPTLTAAPVGLGAEVKVATPQEQTAQRVLLGAQMQVVVVPEVTVVIGV